MKKLILLSLSLGILFSSCEKENLNEPKKKNNILLNDHLVTSKIKQTSSGITLVARFDSKTGVVFITPEKKNITFSVAYQSYKKVNNAYVPSSSMNYGRYVGPFVVSMYPSIPVGTKQKLNLEARTPNGGYFNFIFEENKK